MSDENRTQDEPSERRKEHDEQRSDGGDERGERGATGAEGTGRTHLRPGEVARRAALELRRLRGLEVDGVTGLERIDGGWRVLVEVIEVSRVPASTDVLGAYEVTVDEEGELVRFERLRRYVRAHTGEDDL